MGDFQGTENKRIIRKEWHNPLLSFLCDKLKCKLIYLGLPGPEAEDIVEWTNFIDYVVAFQCRDYPRPSDPGQDKKFVKQLETKLNELERQKKIKSSFVYDGYIEEVLARGEDNSKRTFQQDEFITLYNLDFCNRVTSPLKVIDAISHETKEVYKLHTIRKLLQIQSEIDKKSNKFIMFITLHCDFSDKEIEEFAKYTESQEIKAYHKKINILREKDKRIRLLKSYVFDELKNYFRDYNFVPEFLPVINYLGSGGFWLLHFTVVGTKSTSAGRANCFQNSDDFLGKKILTVKDKKLDFIKIDKISEEDFNIDSIKLVQNSESFKNLWIK